ncbi:LOW QUALITY PROTEIN: putative E3 ubiquitin-protein ligase LIN [Oryza brachyantha]|uniref:LOW QUALITY PROTEIN: putative E3 ubiquitin-protein ligase LIN n=1 Tax=Oryza brachyantha TaxID=4533 RepID=UPI001ADB4E9F|nr:LOW QUALITY PROTEIN: putative E3 ubiquitin-protein ligase LIN [Oryza brachyantha]
MAGPSPTYSSVVAHTAAFLAELIADPLLRRHLLSAAAAGGGGQQQKQQHPAATLQALSLVSDALDTAASSPPSPSSLRAAERLLLSLPAATPLSCLLLALASASRRRGGAAAAAAAAVLDLFALDPALARHELAPAAFEALFAPRLLPVMRHFAARRASAAAAASEGGEDRSVETAAMTAMRVLSLMSGVQATEMRALEREYEKVLDVNCRAYALYLKRILEAGDAARASSPPPPPPELVFSVGDGGHDCDDNDEEATAETDEAVSLQNDVRYNPIWADADEAADLYPRQGSGKGRRELMRPPSLYPQRVPPHLIVQQQKPPAPATGTGSTVSRLRGIEHSATPSDDSMDSSSSVSALLAGREEKHTASPLSRRDRARPHGGEDDDDDDDAVVAILSPEPASSAVGSDGDEARRRRRQQHTVATPKDFVCPITSQVFDDPVTLETGQTYERRAIQEWLDRGNVTCPITRHRLRGAHLPNTNYVLKRLIAAWRDQNPAAAPTPSVSEATTPPGTMDSPAAPFKISSPSPDATGSLASAPSPTSVIAQATLDSTVGELRAAVSCLCTSEELADSEKSVLRIERLWREAGAEQVALSALAKPAVINGFVEILFNSVSAPVLQVAVFLLAELASRDDAVVQTLTRVDSDVDCLVALFKKGLAEAVSLIYLLSPSPEQLVEMDMADALASTIRRNDDGAVKMCIKPKSASVILLSQILLEGGRDSTSPVAKSALVSERFIRGVATSLEAEQVEERIAAVRILLRCVAEDGHCRSSIAEKSALGAVLDAFHVVGDVDKFDIVRLLSELLKLKRRSAADRLLRTIKEASSFSMMHTLLVYLQSTAPEQSPVVAGLLLQLDLLVEPRKMSMYREEAVDSLIQCLKNSDYPRSQLLAAETIMNLPGKFSSSGRPLSLSSLLKLARVKERHRQSQELSISRGGGGGDGEDEMEEEKAASEWERKTAYALVSHEFGLVFEALSECLRAKNAELFTASLASAAWLVHMLSLLPDTGVLGAARVCLLRQFVLVLRSGKHGSDRALAMVALRSFMNDREGMHEITTYIKDVLKTLRELKKSSGLAFEMLKLLSDGQDSSIDMWNHKELNHADCSSNGEVTSIVYLKGYIFSGHSDGTLKVWGGSESILRLVSESQEHTKAITSLAVLPSEEKLFSGSLDRTIRVWQLRDTLRCVEVHDTKDAVQNLAVAAAMACFAPQGAGVKVLSWNGGNSKVLNTSKVVRSMALVHGKLFCGCSDGSVQEIDLASGTVGVIQPGSKRILGKANPIYSLHAHGDLLYAGSASLDGASVKIWSSSNYNLVGTIPSSVEARSLAVSSDLVYLGSRNGVVEIWSREKLTRAGALQAGGAGCRVQCMAVDADGDVLVVGTSDGRIQAWGLT